MNIPNIELLDKIDSPSDIKSLSKSELEALCAELRAFILHHTSVNQEGHLGSNLGVIELTVALHYVYNMPLDSIVWDVGHQAYAHKILTGRKDTFHSNRQYGGISGFPKRSESRYDVFGVGHASTSISAALGIAVAEKLKGDEPNKTIAVIGDGSLTGGLAFEGLNNASAADGDMLIILNDNNMAIDPIKGGLNAHLIKITTSRFYNRVKTITWRVLGLFGDRLRRFIQNGISFIKASLFARKNLFEGLNLRYFGPIDGHDLKLLISTLSDIQKVKGAKVLHIVTKKGKGFTPAENDQTKWHAVPGRFDVETGKVIKDVDTEVKQPPKYQEVFGQTILELAKDNSKIVGITPAMPTGCSLNIMMKEMPERVFDVGIAEEHAVTFSAGLAVGGLLPFCNIYSTFMQRGYDQVIHDVALQKLNVLFCLDRGGIVGADGATHHGVFDLAFMRSIPDITVAAPMNEIELRNMMYTFQRNPQGPMSIRYPRGRGVTLDWKQPFQEMEIGKAEVIKRGEGVAILTIGHIGNYALKATEVLESNGKSVTLVNMRYVKPLDTDMVREIADRHSSIITVEDGVITGGFGSAVIEYLSEINYKGAVKRLGVPDRFIDHGTQDQLYNECGYGVEGIVEAVLDIENR